MTQFVAAGVVVVAGIPLAVNEFRKLHEHRIAGERGADFARLAETAAGSADYDLAVRASTVAVDAAPGEPIFRYALALHTAQRVLNAPESLEPRTVLRTQLILEDAVASGRKDEEIALALGRVHMLRGHADVARRLFEQVVQAYPKSGRALMYQGDLQFKSGELDNAVATLTQAIGLDNTLTQAKFALGQVRLSRKEYDEALPWLETAARELPKSGQAALAFGRVLAAKELWPEAQKSLERALALDPSLVQAHGILGDVYIKNRQIEAAIGSFRIAWEKNHDLEAFRKIGRVYLQLGAIDAAGTVFAQIRDLAPNEPEPHLIVGIAASAAKQGDSAKQSWQRCIELSEGNEAWAAVGAKCKELLESGGALPPPKKPKTP